MSSRMAFLEPELSTHCDDDVKDVPSPGISESETKEASDTLPAD
jgi:hypothetical protein